jgi:hypothetical protein
MPHLTNDHWVKLYYEDSSKGIQIVFIREFMPMCRSCFWREHRWGSIADDRPHFVNGDR